LMCQNDSSVTSRNRDLARDRDRSNEVLHSYVPGSTL
jgi:hypothetical protein